MGLLSDNRTNTTGLFGAGESPAKSESGIVIRRYEFRSVGPMAQSLRWLAKGRVFTVTMHNPCRRAEKHQVESMIPEPPGLSKLLTPHHQELPPANV